MAMENNGDVPEDCAIVCIIISASQVYYESGGNGLSHRILAEPFIVNTSLLLVVGVHGVIVSHYSSTSREALSGRKIRGHMRKHEPPNMRGMLLIVMDIRLGIASLYWVHSREVKVHH